MQQLEHMKRATRIMLNIHETMSYVKTATPIPETEKVKGYF